MAFGLPVYGVESSPQIGDLRRLNGPVPFNAELPLGGSYVPYADGANQLWYDVTDASGRTQRVAAPSGGNSSSLPGVVVTGKASAELRRWREVQAAIADRRMVDYNEAIDLGRKFNPTSPWARNPDIRNVMTDFMAITVGNAGPGAAVFKAFAAAKWANTFRGGLALTAASSGAGNLLGQQAVENLLYAGSGGKYGRQGFDKVDFAVNTLLPVAILGGARGASVLKQSFSNRMSFAAPEVQMLSREFAGQPLMTNPLDIDVGRSAGILGNVDGADSISGSASVGRMPLQWGKTPQATEFLYVQNRTSPLSIESALNQADGFGGFGGNLVDYKVQPNGSVTVDHGGGLSINYQAVPDDLFDTFHGIGKMAAYRSPREFAPNELIGWGDAFEGGVANVHIRQSTLLSDRGSVAAFSHEYGELQTVYSGVGRGSYSLGRWNSFINGAHERVVPQVDRIIGGMIISGGK